MRKITVAAASILVDIDTGSPGPVIERCLAAIDEAGRRGADLIVLPEEPDVLAGNCDLRGEPIPGGAIHARFSAQAAKNDLYVVYSQRERDGDLTYNCGVLLGRRGETIGKYRKTHLAPGEDAQVTAGDDYPVFTCDFGRIAIGLCMDLHYPELWRIYALEGADILCLPTMQMDYTGDHVETLAKARAIDNQVYFVASHFVNQPFLCGRRIGRGRIIDPYGRIIADTSHKPGVALAEIDLDEGYEYWVKGELKKKYPTLKECYLGMRRPETYGRLTEPDPEPPAWKIERSKVEPCWQ